MEGGEVSDQPLFKPGEVVTAIVGLPGPDVDDAVIIRHIEANTYEIKYQVYGRGAWHYGLGYAGERRIGGIFKIAKDAGQ